MADVFLLSDSHFFHSNIIRYCNRPFEDEDKMNEEMEKRWSLMVNNDDIFIHVGDLTAGLKGRKDDLKALIGRLPGRKVLVRGNHDHMKDEWYIEAGFERVVDYFVAGNVLFAHVPDVVDSTHPHPWADITKKLREHHSPILTIHGHDHRANIPEYDGHFNCAADRHAYMPFTLKFALERSGLSEKADEVCKDVFRWLDEKNA